MSYPSSGPLTHAAYFSDLQRSLSALDRAKKARHRVDACPECGGPRVYSRISPKARCFRCATGFDLSHTTTLKPSIRRCKLCRKQNMAGRPIKNDYCAECWGLSPRERSKRLRWAAERKAAATP